MCLHVSCLKTPLTLFPGALLFFLCHQSVSQTFSSFLPGIPSFWKASCLLPPACGRPLWLPSNIPSIFPTAGCLLCAWGPPRAGVGPGPTFQNTQAGRSPPHCPSPQDAAAHTRKSPARTLSPQMTLMMQNGVSDKRRERHTAPNCSGRLWTHQTHRTRLES